MAERWVVQWYEDEKQLRLSFRTYREARFWLQGLLNQGGHYPSIYSTGEST